MVKQKNIKIKMAEEKDNVFTLPTKTELDVLKKKHGKLFQITIKSGSKEYHAIVRKPKIADLQVASASEKRNHLRSMPLFGLIASLLAIRQLNWMMTY